MAKLSEPSTTSLHNQRFLALVATSQNTEFLAMVLQNAQEAFPDPDVRRMVLTDTALWASTTELFHHCIVDNFTVDPADLDIIEPRDVPALDDLELRSHCVWSLGQIPVPEALEKLEGVLHRHTELLGSDAARAMRTILMRAVENNDSIQVGRVNAALAKALKSRGIRRKDRQSVARINIAMGFAVPQNLSAMEVLGELSKRERDRDVARFLQQAQSVIQQTTY